MLKYGGELLEITRDYCRLLEITGDYWRSQGSLMVGVYVNHPCTLCH